MMNAEATGVNVRSVLEDLRERLIRELHTVDEAIKSLPSSGYAVTPPGDGRPQSVSHEYLGKKPYEAAIAFMQARELKEIGLDELTTELMKRGVVLGDDPKRSGTVLKIALTQNNKHGRKEITIDGDRVIRKVRRHQVA